MTRGFRSDREARSAAAAGGGVGVGDLEGGAPETLDEIDRAAADEVEADDVTVIKDGVTLIVDPVSLDLVRGATVDFVESLGGAAFQVTNPNAASGCGCGTSFSI